MTANNRRSFVFVALAAACAISPRAPVRADGFQLNRFEPAAAGSWFFGVEHPWYSSTRYVAAGLTFDYGHNVLLGGSYGPGGTFRQRNAIIEHQLVGHLDIAGSFLDRVQVSATLPVVLYENGTAAYGVSPLGSPAVSDPRFGILARIWGQADRDPISIHAGAYLWAPVGASAQLAGDPGVRGMPQLVLAGLARRHLRWAASGGVLIRGTTSLGAGPASSIGSELQLRGGIAWADSRRHFNIGPELSFSTAVTGANALASKATSLEILVGGQWNVARVFQVGAAVGIGLVPTLGTPDVRALLRIAYAPAPRPFDSDDDGIPDARDACPEAAGVASRDPSVNGCPDADRDGVPDADDVCPNDVAGARPDPTRKGCAAKDSDGDGVPDAEDLCPTSPAGAHPDPKKPGCAAKDSDGDGVPDAEDLCPGQIAGAHPQKGSAGCPEKDVDGDGVPDAEDLCPKSPSGAMADPKRPGCPVPDADADGIPDAVDGCPRIAGKPDVDPRKSGCPAFAGSGSLTELKSVHFDTNEATLLAVSFPILDELVGLLNIHPEVRTVFIEGHADDTGTHEFNQGLSRRRADSVVKYLEKKGVKQRRLRAVGFGDTRPLSPDRSDEARAKNRRVEMRIPEQKK